MAANLSIIKFFLPSQKQKIRKIYFNVKANAPLKILKSFTMTIARSTCITGFYYVRCCFTVFLRKPIVSSKKKKKNDEMVYIDFLLTSKSLMLKILYPLLS